MKKSKRKLYLTKRNIINLGVIIGFIICAIYFSAKFNLDDIIAYIQQNPGQALILSLIIYIAFGFTFLPSVPLTIFMAVLIGPLQAAIIASFGNTIAALVEYQIGRSVGDVVDFEEKKTLLPFGLGKLPIDSPFFMLAARAVPAGTRAYSMVCGAYQVPLPTYAWTTFIMFLINSTALTFLSARFLPWIG